jgi:hypothetical protein
MKKKLLFGIAMMIGAVGFSQNQISQTMNAHQSSPVLKTFSHKDYSKTYTNNKAINKYWLSYVDHYANIYGETPYGLIGNLLFPDSTILVDYGTSGFGSTWVHRVGQVFDLNAPVVQLDGITVDQTKKFTIDTLSSMGIYRRVDNSVVDTLRFRVVVPSVSQMNGVSYFGPTSGVTANLNPGDTVFMIAMDWNFSTLSTPGVIFPQTGVFGNKFGVIMDFLPGYSWVPNMDTLQFNKNSWWFGSYELSGQSTYPIYSKSDYNHAAILPKDVRYNNAGGWNDQYIPSFAYMGTNADYRYESLALQVHISQDDAVSVEEINNSTSFSVYPNPSQGNFNISLESEKAETLQLMVTDIIGKTVINKTINVSGKSLETISLNEFGKGIYLLNIGGKTAKLIVE